METPKHPTYTAFLESLRNGEIALSDSEVVELLSLLTANRAKDASAPSDVSRTASATQAAAEGVLKSDPPQATLENLTPDERKILDGALKTVTDEEVRRQRTESHLKRFTVDRLGYSPEYRQVLQKLEEACSENPQSTKLKEILDAWKLVRPSSYQLEEHAYYLKHFFTTFFHGLASLKDKTSKDREVNMKSAAELEKDVMPIFHAMMQHLGYVWDWKIKNIFADNVRLLNQTRQIGNFQYTVVAPILTNKGRLVHRGEIRFDA